MGPIPVFYDDVFKWLAVFALIGVGALFGLGIEAIYWIVEHVRFVK